MRILIIGGYRPFTLRGLRGGGGPNAVSAPLVDAFAKINLDGIQITVLSTPFREMGIPLFKPVELRLSNCVKVQYIPVLNPFFILRELVRCDLVHVFALESRYIVVILFSKFLRKKIVVSSHGYSPMEMLMKPKGLKFNFYNFLIRKIIDLSDAVTTVSYILRSVLVHTLRIPEVEANKITVIHNGTDITPIYRDKGDDLLKIISVLGRNYINKGLYVIIKALEKVHPSIRQKISLTLVGDVPLTFLSEIPPDFALLTFKKVPREMLAKLYDEAHVILQPSFFESFNLPALEAAGRGCIPIVTTKMGVAEIFEDKKSALIVQPGDSDSIAKLIELLATNNDLRRRMSQAAYKKSLNYTYDKVSRRYLLLYLHVLRRKTKC